MLRLLSVLRSRFFSIQCFLQMKFTRGEARGVLALAAVLVLLLAVMSWRGGGGAPLDVPSLPSEVKSFADSVAAGTDCVASDSCGGNAVRPAESVRRSRRGDKRGRKKAGRGAESVADRPSPLDEPV